MKSNMKREKGGKTHTHTHRVSIAGLAAGRDKTNCVFIFRAWIKLFGVSAHGLHNIHKSINAYGARCRGERGEIKIQPRESDKNGACRVINLQM